MLGSTKIGTNPFSEIDKIEAMYVFAGTIICSSPEAFVFFGGLTKAGDLLMKPLIESYNKHILKIFKDKAKFYISGLEGSSAAVLGASAVGWEI